MIVIRARPLVFASLDISRYKEIGYEIRIVKNVVHNRRLAKIHRNGIDSMFGMSDRNTCGIVSPVSLSAVVPLRKEARLTNR